MLDYYGLSTTLSSVGVTSVTGGATLNIKRDDCACLLLMSGVSSVILSCAVTGVGKKAAYEEINSIFSLCLLKS